MVVWKTLCGNVCQDVSPLSRKRKHGSNLYSLQSGPPLLKENIGFQIIVRSCEQKKNCPAVEDPQGDLQNNCNQMGLNIIIVRVLEREKSSPNHCSVVQAFIIQAFVCHNLRSFLAANSTQNYFLIVRMFLWHSRQKCPIWNFATKWDNFWSRKWIEREEITRKWGM